MSTYLDTDLHKPWSLWTLVWGLTAGTHKPAVHHDWRWQFVEAPRYLFHFQFRQQFSLRLHPAKLDRKIVLGCEIRGLSVQKEINWLYQSQPKKNF